MLQQEIKISKRELHRLQRNENRMLLFLTPAVETDYVHWFIKYNNLKVVARPIKNRKGIIDTEYFIFDIEFRVLFGKNESKSSESEVFEMTDKFAKNMVHRDLDILRKNFLELEEKIPLITFDKE